MSDKASVKKKRGGIIIGVCVVIIIILLTVIIFLLLGKNNADQNPVKEKQRDVVVNPDNVEEVVQQLNETSERTTPGTYEVTMNSTWQFADGKSASDNAYVENAAANTNDVYFDIQISDTEETIYESPILPVGSYLDSITLDQELAAGTYDCVMIYHLLDEEGSSISTVRVSLTINIAN